MKQLLTASLLTVLLLVGNTSQGLTQQRFVSSQSEGFAALTLEIALPKEEFFQLEPIPITLNLKNDTDHPIMGHAALDFDLHHVRLSVTPADGQKTQLKDLTMLRSLVSVPRHQIKPGQSYQSKQLITIGLNRSFPQPGTYQLQAVFTDVDGAEKVESNVLTIRILEPTGLNTQALNFINSNADPAYFFNGYGLSLRDNSLEVLQEFVSRFEQSAYGDYATFLLGETLFSMKDYGRALPHLTKLAENSNFIFADKVTEYLNKTQETLRAKTGRASN